MSATWGEITPPKRPYGKPLPDCLDGLAQLVARDVMPESFAWHLLKRIAQPCSWHQESHLRDNLQHAVWSYDCLRWDAAAGVRKALSGVLFDHGDAAARRAACIQANADGHLTLEELGALSREESAHWLRIHAKLEQDAPHEA